jgi:hypothetical protein
LVAVARRATVLTAVRSTGAGPAPATLNTSLLAAGLFIAGNNLPFEPARFGPVIDSRGCLGSAFYLVWNDTCGIRLDILPPMTTQSSFPDEIPSEFIPLSSKEGRAQDAEMIRQDFIKSKGSLAPQRPNQVSPGELGQDER